MSVGDKFNKLIDDITSAYSALDSKGAIMPYNKNTDNLSSTIESLSTGDMYPIIEGTGKHEVRFIDYDGVIIKQCYVNDGEDAIPPTLEQIPNHDGLIFTRWNNSLYNNVTRDEDTGAVYDTSDGRTHIFHTVTEENILTKTLAIHASSYPQPVVITVYWGDGESSTVTYTSTGVKNIPHSYAPGVYDLSIESNDGYELRSLLGDSAYMSINSGATEIRCSKSVRRMSAYVFNNAFNLEKIMFNTMSTLTVGSSNGTIPLRKLKCVVLSPEVISAYSISIVTKNSGIKYMPIWEGAETDYMISCWDTNTAVEKIIPPRVCPRSETANNSIGYCYNCSKYYTPSNLTTIAANAFRQTAVTEVILPEGVNIINAYLCYDCRSLLLCSIPSTCTSIGNYAWYQCYNLYHIYLYPIVPPTLGGVNAFSNVTSRCIIHVPAGSLEAYQTATNWSAQASKMVGDL